MSPPERPARMGTAAPSTAEGSDGPQHLDGHGPRCRCWREVHVATVDGRDRGAAVDHRLVPAIGRRGHRQRERDPAIIGRPRERERPPKEPARRVEVAGRDGVADLRAAHRPPAQVERRHRDDLEPVARTKLGERVRRAAPLEAEGGVGRHQEPGQRRARPDPPDERVVGGVAQRVVEVLDDRDLDAGGLEPLESLVAGRSAAAAPGP